MQQAVSNIRVSVFGIGYVGAVTSACISASGHPVTAVDVSPAKVEMLLEGRSPIVEPGLQELLKHGVESGRLTAVSDAREAIMTTDLSIICVGTPSLHSGNLDLSYVAAVAEEIGAAIAEKSEFHSVVMRSTMLPGSMVGTVIPILERASGKRAGEGFGVAYYPEFLREATAIKDYEDPSVIVMGQLDETTIDRLRQINNQLSAPEYIVDISTAEAIKYANNSWHAVKITFANEIGNLSRSAGIDGAAVMTALCMDKRLNISPAYLRPGMAYGGSCLPKDLRALTYKARSLDVPTPLLNAVSESNSAQIGRAFDMITQFGKKRIGFLGLSFKAGTDDLRESPLVELAERLHGKGHSLKIYDQNVHLSTLMGANLSYVRAHLPHLAEFLVEDMDEVYDHADVLVIGNSDPAFRDAPRRANGDKAVVDLVRIDPDARSDGQLYVGLCW